MAISITATKTVFKSQTEAIFDYQKVLDQQDELARLRARMLIEAGEQMSAHESELAAMQAQLASLQEQGGQSDVYKAEIARWGRPVGVQGSLQLRS